MKGEKAIRTYKELLIDFTNCLEEIEIPYVIVGGATVGVFGIGRSTEDIDVLIKLRASDSDRIHQLVGCLNEKSLSVTNFEIKTGLEEKGHITIFDLKNPMIRVDLSPISNKLALNTFNNRIRVDLFGNEKYVWINSPEALVAIKLSPGFQSEQDISDVKGILLRSKETLKWEKLRQLCNQVGSRKQLEEILIDLDIQNE